ncbi:ABC transporter substrate-binding protein [Leptolyngbya ohadii]|uniref:ABC transporter substrate-binding protein n=1 Tax=Leptolyngbya ohadii TaxID=1962290 RepID=UPI000B598D79|nr:ABC transporter substrate-binding protein [Leptolyngbya ohadii]
MIGRLKRGWFALFALAAALTVTLSNCGTAPTQNAANPSGNPSGNPGGSPAAQTDASTLVFGSVGDPVTLESGNVTDGYSVAVQQQIYDRLLDAKPGTTDLVPALATEYSASADGRTWTFKLRDGVKFHDGTPFNAEAVRFNVNRWWDEKDPNSFRDGGKTYETWVSLFGGFKGSPDSLLQEIQVVDPTTIRFVLKEPFAAFPAAIASGYFGIASPDAVKKAGGDYGIAGSPAIGTGPYRLKEWRTGDRVILEKNPDYWQAGLPKTDQVVFRTIKEASSRLAELRAGTIDFTENLSPQQIQEIQSDSNLKELRRPSFNTGYLALNPAYEPLSKKEVRQAIAMAIDRKQLVEAFWSGLGTVDSHFTPPSMKEFQDASLGNYEYNPDKAKKMLADAGYPNGFDLEVWYAPINGASFPNPKPTAEAWAAELSSIGIRVKLNTKDWAAYLADRLKSPGYQAFMLGWTGDYGDPDNFFYPHFGKGSTTDIGNWKNDRVFSLLQQARSTPNQDDRAKMYAEVDKILFEEAVRIPMVHAEPLLAQRSNLSGWTPSPFGSESFANITKQ